MTKTLQGIVRGRTIELMGDPGIADGQQVQVVLTAPGEATPGEGIMRTAGALADDPYWDDIMAEVHHTRKLERRSQAEEPSWA